jgi:hypothetical protein
MEKDYTVADVIEIGEAEEMILGKNGRNVDELENEFIGVDLD